VEDKTRKPGKQPIPQEKKDEIAKIVCPEKPKEQTHTIVKEGELWKRSSMG
jgi:hypothetical protein